MTWTETPAAGSDAPSAEPPAAPAIRLDLSPERIEQDLARLVLTLVEFLLRLMEAQAARRLSAGALADADAERLGETLMRARDAVVSISARLGVPVDSLNLDLGPLGRLL